LTGIDPGWLDLIHWIKIGWLLAVAGLSSDGG
jgi:hypothetical protein